MVKHRRMIYIYIVRYFTSFIDIIFRKIWLLLQSVQLLHTTTKLTLSLKREEMDVHGWWNIDVWYIYIVVIYVVHRYDFPEDLTFVSVSAATAYNYKSTLSVERDETDVPEWWSINDYFFTLKHESVLLSITNKNTNNYDWNDTKWRFADMVSIISSKNILSSYKHFFFNIYYFCSPHKKSILVHRINCSDFLMYILQLYFLKVGVCLYACLDVCHDMKKKSQ